MHTCIHQKGRVASSESELQSNAIYDLLKKDVYRRRAEKFTEQELKDAIVQSWEQITLEQICSCLYSWKKRLRLVCQADGGHIEHLL